MDSLITAAARALAAGDPLGALKRVALRDDAASARAARHRDGAARRPRARQGSAAECGARLRPEGGGGPRTVRRRRSRDRARLARSQLARANARTRRGRRSKRMAIGSTPRMRGYLEVRRLLLIGRLDEAERTLAELDPDAASRRRRGPAHELVVAGIAMRRMRTKSARAALTRAGAGRARGGYPCADGGGRKRGPGARRRLPRA